MADTDDDDDLMAEHRARMASMTHPFEPILGDTATHAASMDSATRPYAPPTDDMRVQLLREAFNDEALRRMARRGSVESVTQKGALAVNDELRSVADLMLDNLCEKAFILAEYHRKQTITASILRETLEALDVKIDTYHEPREDGLFPACRSHRKERDSRRGEIRKRGTVAQKEIEHESKNVDCVYTQRIPFLRLLKTYLLPPW